MPIGADACTPSPAIAYGRYRVWAWRGVEYERFEGEVDLSAGRGRVELAIPLERARENEVFSFMNSAVSSEKPKKLAIHDIARCENVVVKLGGLAMCLLGYDFHLRPKPPSSEEAANAWRPYIETCIEAFGSRRCMFDSLSILPRFVP